ncbi:MAG: redoxin domain-containing protein, partial [Deltaproteobacteria bacterium]|nr:redoxin domain-containing protein [Deltaproteobacteria bacterium]
MPALDALQGRFEAAHTQVVGISIDSVYCHANWADSLGGISVPLLADFHPKGAVAEAFGLYLADNGITDRATVIIDADGVVQHISAVGPGGSRDIDELAGLAEG